MAVWCRRALAGPIAIGWEYPDTGSATSGYSQLLTYLLPFH